SAVGCRANKKAGAIAPALPACPTCPTRPTCPAGLSLLPPATSAASQRAALRLGEPVRNRKHRIREGLTRHARELGHNFTPGDRRDAPHGHAFVSLLLHAASLE